MADFQRIGNVIDKAKHPEPIRPQPPVFRYAADDAEQMAQSERHLQELAGKPLIVEGRVIYKCRACNDMHFVRARVPFGHRLFGLVRLCPCDPRSARFGAEWFSFTAGG